MWWPQSSLTLHFGESAYYRRVVLACACLSWWAGFQIEIARGGQIVWMLCVLAHTLWVLREAIPTGKPVVLMYVSGSWLYRRGDVFQPVTSVNILIHTGFFLLLRVQGTERSWRYVIFQDQMTSAERRRLMWLHHAA